MSRPLNFGSNFNAAQLVTWNGVEIVLVPPSLNCTVPVSDIFEQLVGLNWKFPRVVVALTCWISRGIPSMLVGIESGEPGGLEVIVIADGHRVQFDLAPHDHAVARRMVVLRVRQVERAGLRGHLERHAERRAPRFADRAATAAVVGAGEIELPAGDRERLVADTNTDRRFADLAVFPAQPFDWPAVRGTVRHPSTHRRGPAAVSLRPTSGSVRRLCGSTSPSTARTHPPGCSSHPRSQSG